MNTELEQRTRAEVVDAYAAVTRLRVYMRLALAISVLFFLADLGGMIVGWLPVDVGVLGLVAAALTATITVAKSYESVHRTTLYAMELERTLPGDDDLDTSSVTGQSLRSMSGVALAVTLVLGTGIVAYSVTNEGTQQPITDLSQAFVAEDERDDDDDDGDERDQDGDTDANVEDGSDADEQQGDQQQNETTEDQSDSGGESSNDDDG